MRLITLTTDFGEGSYVAQMKGVIHSLARGAVIVDITHTVAPGDVREAAYILETVVPAFPEETVHVVVVDPGVGTDRRALAVSFAGRILIGPDNGVLTPFFPGAGEVRELTERALFLPEVSATFHGRDIFAPVAAYLAEGTEIGAVGPRVDEDLVKIQDLLADGDQGVVLHVDRFGNLVTSFVAEELTTRPDARLAGPDREVAARARTFGEAPPDEPFLFAGSGGRVEVAVPGGNAHDLLGWGRGTKLTIVEDPQ